LRGTGVNKQAVDVQMDGGTQKQTPKQLLGCRRWFTWICSSCSLSLF